MERIKFHIKRTGWGFLSYWFANELICIGLILMAFISSIQSNNYYTFIFMSILMLPIIIFIWKWRTITIQGDRMVIHYGIYGLYCRVNLATVFNVHYKEKGEDFLGKNGFNTPFQNYQDVVCFQTPKGRYHIAVKETKEFYKLLKKREVHPEAE